MNTTTIAAPDPACPNSALGFALMAIIEGLSDTDVEYLPEPGTVAAELAALRGAGVGPRRAAVLLGHLDDGRALTVHDGGGQCAPAPRPALRLVQGGRRR